MRAGRLGSLSQQIETTRITLDRLSDSPIDWAAYVLSETVEVAPKKELRPHQQDALNAVREGLAEGDRGKLVMACGTGKTFTGLKIAEHLVGVGKSVLFLVPSLSLMSQTIREWTIDSKTPLSSFAVCSDAQVGKRRRSNDDVAELEAHDLDYPATTNAAKLAQKAALAPADRMTVVFATYQSLPVVASAQSSHGLPEFDLIICDEAHRTTGASFPGEEDSNFIKVHDQSFIAGKKRLYMTATPRVFGDAVKSKADDASVTLCSMDNEDLFGPTLFTRGFGWAVENNLLTDYKVVVLAVDEGMVSSSIQSRLADGGNELKLDDATKIIGCYKALTKNGLAEDVGADPDPMRRALAFCKDINSSKLVRDEFAAVIADYLASEEAQDTEAGRQPLGCELQHVDGTFNAKERNRCLDWLKSDAGEDTCRILTNARCLSEGVDVPALDAILFMHPRKSQIDVVQSVGRVMRRAPGKRMGYVILPIGVPAGMTPEEALSDNERYRVVWQILNALRSHDERLDATINKMDLGVDVSDQIEVIAVSNKLPSKAKATKGKANIGHGSAADDDDESDDLGNRGVADEQIEFVFDEFSKAIIAKIVKKCGKRDYWENWAGDIAEIARKHITRITAVVEKDGTPERAAFEEFLTEIRDDLNESISEVEAVEMLAQHIITRPVFEALFEGYSFAQHNPVSRAMQSVLEVLDTHNLEKEAESLDKFYASVKRRAEGIDNAEAKQKIIVELYDKFFRNAFPKMTERLGIVYTPVEVVDFIIHSVNEVLQAEFGQTLGSRGVHILDPFTGTGTFITRLLQSGLISPEELEHKYRHEIHANEIVLLAYYIAAINIEATFQGLAGGDYAPFEGICLTDTFQLYEKADLVSGMMADNSTRRTRQKSLPIRVIIGNPPYSVGQGSANDDAANVAYPSLDERVRETYAAASTNTNKRALYDSYVRAFRWASDRVGESGIVAFVTNAGWIDGNAMDGMRRSLQDEFSDIYVFHLRGNARTSGEHRRKEKDNVFGQGSRAPVAITLLIKKEMNDGAGRIVFHDIGDYLSRTEKLARIAAYGSVSGIAERDGWTPIQPDEHADWLSQRDESYGAFMLASGKKSAEPTIFAMHTRGVQTTRDAWCFNASKTELWHNVSRAAAAYEDYAKGKIPGGKDATEFSWCEKTRRGAETGKSYTPVKTGLRISAFRPFTKSWLYTDGFLNWSAYRTGVVFPEGVDDNLAIGVPSRGFRGEFSALICRNIPGLYFASTDCSEFFPLKILSEAASDPGSLFAESKPNDLSWNDGVTDEGLEHFQTAYPDIAISKEDLFFYIYGLFHSDDYKSRFTDNLKKELPRIPRVSRSADFLSFSQAGRKLAELHLEYELVEPYPITLKEGDLSLAIIDDPEAFYRVEKMKFGGKRPNLDKTTVIYNPRITMTNIPLEAYDYVVNGKPALEWVMERQVVKTDKDSGIVNDANRYSIESIGDPAYPLKLFQRVITVSLETMKIVRSLPPLDIRTDTPSPATTH